MTRSILLNMFCMVWNSMPACDVLTRLGHPSLTTFKTCRFDFCGNGESEGKFRYGNYVKEVAPC